MDRNHVFKLPKYGLILSGGICVFVGVDYANNSDTGKRLSWFYKPTSSACWAIINSSLVAIAHKSTLLSSVFRRI